ncbi:MAG: sigma-70 region 4 domain-containing protein [Anaeroplasma bactoclasticum]|nr:sigma-70 region 4 domain-containing protein [Anaeroplasma bactoclasticum]
MKSSDITADILYYLSDYQQHTYAQIADNLECSLSTVKRHIQSMAYKNMNIEVKRGGFGGGGVRLIPDECLKTNFLSEDELQLIFEKLVSLQDTSPSIKRFANSIAPLIEKRRNVL